MMRSLFYTTNGVLVVLIQIPISLLVERQLKNWSESPEDHDVRSVYSWHIDAIL
ncbi:hypothetical protein JCM18909_4009 [Cutibacterium acnes JCM 18909]|nr:hypothetical protein JCM18909_4009 [Cutibacterium acnes JCM 18909]